MRLVYLLRRIKQPTARTFVLNIAEAQARAEESGVALCQPPPNQDLRTEPEEPKAEGEHGQPEGRSKPIPA